MAWQEPAPFFSTHILQQALFVLCDWLQEHGVQLEVMVLDFDPEAAAKAQAAAARALAEAEAGRSADGGAAGAAGQGPGSQSPSAAAAGAGSAEGAGAGASQGTSGSGVAAAGEAGLLSPSSKAATTATAAAAASLGPWDPFSNSGGGGAGGSQQELEQLRAVQGTNLDVLTQCVAQTGSKEPKVGAGVGWGCFVRVRRVTRACSYSYLPHAPHQPAWLCTHPQHLRTAAALLGAVRWREVAPTALFKGNLTMGTTLKIQV